MACTSTGDSSKLSKKENTIFLEIVFSISVLEVVNVLV